MTLAKSFSQRSGRITDGIWQVLNSFKVAGHHGLFYKIEAVPVLLTVLGRFITASQWDKIVERLRTVCSSSSIHRLPLGMGPTEDSQDSQASICTSCDMDGLSPSNALPVSPASTLSSPLQDSQSQDVVMVDETSKFSTKQLLNRCVSVSRELFSDLTTDEQLHHIQCRDVVIARLRSELYEAILSTFCFLDHPGHPGLDV